MTFSSNGSSGRVRRTTSRSRPTRKPCKGLKAQREKLAAQGLISDCAGEARDGRMRTRRLKTTKATRTRTRRARTAEKLEDHEDADKGQERRYGKAAGTTDVTGGKNDDALTFV